eukprot:scaffold278011_cov36-Tisochrysis_lutea.AAC.4
MTWLEAEGGMLHHFDASLRCSVVKVAVLQIGSSSMILCVAHRRCSPTSQKRACVSLPTACSRPPRPWHRQTATRSPMLRHSWLTPDPLCLITSSCYASCSPQDKR